MFQKAYGSGCICFQFFVVFFFSFLWIFWISNFLLFIHTLSAAVTWLLSMHQVGNSLISQMSFPLGLCFWSWSLDAGLLIKLRMRASLTGWVLAFFASEIVSNSQSYMQLLVNSSCYMSFSNLSNSLEEEKQPYLTITDNCLWLKWNLYH